MEDEGLGELHAGSAHSGKKKAMNLRGGDAPAGLCQWRDRLDFSRVIIKQIWGKLGRATSEKAGVQRVPTQAKQDYIFQIVCAGSMLGSSLA